MKLFEINFLTQHTPLEIHVNCYVYHEFGVAFYDRDKPQMVTHWRTSGFLVLGCMNTHVQVFISFLSLQ
jgi:hypothetical protein